jgi:hypothetical protein
MEREYLEECIDKNMSINQIASENGKGATTIRYWLTKFELKTNRKSFKDGGSKTEYYNGKTCPSCKECKTIDKFYDRRGKKGGAVYCIVCSNDESRERGRRFKQKCVDYKGGCCQECGYNKYIGALQFHHLDPTQKDFALSKVKSHSFNDKIKGELNKCILVCANCHFEIHGSMV